MPVLQYKMSTSNEELKGKKVGGAQHQILAADTWGERSPGSWRYVNLITLSFCLSALSDISNLHASGWKEPETGMRATKMRGKGLLLFLFFLQKLVSPFC